MTRFTIFNLIASNERKIVNELEMLWEETVAAHLGDNPGICQEEPKTTTTSQGRDTTQAVSRRPVTTEAQIQS